MPFVGAVREALAQREWRRPFITGITIVFIGVILLACVALALAGGAYAYVSSTLPSAEELTVRANTFESTKIFDRNGVLLYEVFDPTGGRRTVVPLESMPVQLRQALIATEDPTFYENPGFNLLSIVRAFWQNLREREIVSGASTITQQLVKSVYLSPEVTFERKAKEAILAAEITRRFSKDEILEIYLNRVYFGSMAYGIGSAAEVYFDKTANELTLGESALLVGILQGPALYDPYTNLAGAQMRQEVVLDLMVKRGYLTRDEARAAQAEALHFAERRIEMKAPHFVVYVREQLEAQYGTELVDRGGLRVYTSLDISLQEEAERIVQAKVAEVRELDASNAALLALDPHSGQILAMVGSADFYDDDIDGQVNVCLRLRQPGSSIKPVTYAAAFERGWTAATFIMDVRTEFPDGANSPYVPKNHDDKEHGPVLLRGALARSLNIPAVKTLQFVTLPGMLEMAHRLGIQSLNRPDYGLSLTLGGGDVTMLELAGAYCAFANEGHRVKPVSILRVEDSRGRRIAETLPALGPQVLDPRHAYLLTSILSDKEARLPTYGPNNALELSRPAAAKTGTTDDYRDAWTIGYTPDLVTAVWVGNSSGEPMKHVYGGLAAAPIWHDFMEEALQDTAVHEFLMPDGMELAEICPVSGKLRGEKCPAGVKEVFVAGTAPTAACDIHTDVRLCSVSGKRAGEFCPSDAVYTQYYEVYPVEYRAWAEAQGKLQPPSDICDVHTRAPHVEISEPRDGSMLQGIVPILGSARIDDMDHYEVQYGIGDNPFAWILLHQQNVALENGVLAAWNTWEIPNGIYSLRVVALDRRGNSAATPALRVNVSNPTPTATSTPTATGTPTPTPEPTASPTQTEVPSPTPAATEAPTETPFPSTPTAHLEPTETPTLPAPTETVSATELPEPTDTPEPTPTGLPTPTGAPEPTPTPAA